MPYQNKTLTEIQDIFADPAIKRIIIPCTVNLHATSLLSSLNMAMSARPELKVFYMVPPRHMLLPPRQFPNAIPLTMPSSSFSTLRYLKYLRLRKHFDLVLQLDYQPILPLSWVAKQNLFVNDQSYCLRPAPKLADIIRILPLFLLIKKWFSVKK